MALSIDSAIAATLTENRSTRTRQYKGTAASIGSVTGMEAGDTFRETDGSRLLWYYDGAAWIFNQPGATKLRPGAVSGSGISISANGDIALSAATGTVNIDNVFPASCRAVQIDIQLTTSGTADNVIQMYLRAGGSKVGGSTDYSLINNTMNIGVGPSRGENISAASWPIMRASASGGAFCTLTLQNPRLAGARRFGVGKSIDAGSYARDNYFWTGGSGVPVSDGFALILHATSGSTGSIGVTALY